MSQPDTQDSLQALFNRSYDPTNLLNMVEPVEYDGVTFRKKQSDLMALRIQKSGTDTFVAFAPIGTTDADNKWQALKIDSNGNMTWADGNASFDNVATDLTILTYI